jgi:ADP-heptose:LPS heptosyltransferase
MEFDSELVDVDLRGKTNYQELAYVLKNSSLHVGIDSFPMHVCASFNVPLVAIFGCSYATSTGPWYKDLENAKYILLQSDRLTGCRDRACYKHQCVANPEYPPINEIDPREIFNACVHLMNNQEGNNE